MTSPLRLLHLSASPPSLSAPAPVVFSACLPAEAPVASDRILPRKEGGFLPLRLVLHSGFYSFEVFAHCFCHLLQLLRVGSQKPERPAVPKHSSGVCVGF